MKHKCINCAREFNTTRTDKVQCCPACKRSWPGDSIELNIMEAFMNLPSVQALIQEKEQGK